MAAPKVGSEAWRARYGPWALVAGPAHGLGAAWSHALGQAGLKVLAVDVEAAGLDARLAALRADGVEAAGRVVDLGPRPVGPRVLEIVGTSGSSSSIPPSARLATCSK